VTQPAAQSVLQRNLKHVQQDKAPALGVAIWTDDEHCLQWSCHHMGLAFDLLGLNVPFPVIFKQERAADLQILVQYFIV